MAFRVIHYINQFFGGIGGEEKADIAPELREGIVGPGAAFKAAFNGEAEIVATVICGDNHCVANMDAVAGFVLDAVKKYKADGVITGPAFNAGRYGMAAGGVAAAVAKTGLPTLSAMFPENPGVELYKAGTYILPTDDSARGMGKAIPAMADFAMKLLTGAALKTAEEDG